MQTFFQRLKHIRADMSITQKEMAERTGVTFGTYRRYEAGETSPPIEFLLVFIEMGYSLEWLLSGRGDKHISPAVLDMVRDGGLDYKDPGLEELLSPLNRGKFLVTEAEAEELGDIAKNRQSDSSLKNWVSILYILRELS